VPNQQSFAINATHYVDKPPIKISDFFNLSVTTNGDQLPAFAFKNINSFIVYAYDVLPLIGYPNNGLLITCASHAQLGAEETNTCGDGMSTSHSLFNTILDVEMNGTIKKVSKRILVEIPDTVLRPNPD
jgi:hypothetical protein